MRRKIVLFIIVTICFLLQTTIFPSLTFANIAPNLLLIVVASFGLMRGKKEGLWIGFFCGYFICTSVTSMVCSKNIFTRMISNCLWS